MPEQRWLLLGNCQVFGLANCLSSLARGLTVEAYDQASYRRAGDEVTARLHEFDRIIVNPGLRDQLPSAQADRGVVVSCPAVFFGGYHPDLCYLAPDGPLAKGPFGHYHSAVAYASFVRGFTVEQTLALYNRDTYARLGYLDSWDSERRLLVHKFAVDGFDIGARFVAWSRKGPFMHIVNHPRIDVLMDIARMLLDHAGIEVVEPGFVPHDNLANGAVFPVYPEIAASLGLQGGLRFKSGSDYRLMDLDEFVSRSFEVYRDAGNTRPADLAFFARLDIVGARLAGEPDPARKVVGTEGGSRTRTYRSLFARELERSGDFPGVFVFGMNRSGSGLLHSMVERVCKAADIPAINIPDRMFVNGLLNEWPTNPEVLDLLGEGRIHYGFRQLPPILKDPSVGLRGRRAVLLVRDPRDALVSRYFYSGGRFFPNRGPGANAENSRAAISPTAHLDIDEFVLAKAEEHLQRLTDYRDSLDFGQVLLRRYEDVYYDKRTLLGEVFEHFGLPVPRGVLDRVAAFHDVRPDREDPTRHIRKGTPGDHRMKLRPETITALNDIFRDIAGWYGYDLDPRVENAQA